MHKQGITTRRPADFFAEMAKSDSHMNKVIKIFFFLCLKLFKIAFLPIFLIYLTIILPPKIPKIVFFKNNINLWTVQITKYFSVPKAHHFPSLCLVENPTKLILFWIFWGKKMSSVRKLRHQKILWILVNGCQKKTWISSKDYFLKTLISSKGH